MLFLTYTNDLTELVEYKESNGTKKSKSIAFRIKVCYNDKK